MISTPRDVAVPSETAEPAAALGRATLTKVAWRLLPFLLLLYIVAWIDRVNIGIADALTTMRADVGLNDWTYGLGAGVFFVAYAFCEVPSNLVLARVGARRWIARIMITWGILSVAMLFAHSPLSFGVLRFLLGAAEAGFLPGIIYYLGHWFPSAERARAVSWFMLGIPLSSVVGQPLGGAIIGLDGLQGLKGWQWLFLLEGVPAVLLGIVALFFLTDAPEHARWLTAEQRDWLSRKVRAEHTAAERSHGISLKAALLHPTVWLLCVILFACQTCSYGLTLWINQIVKSLGGLTSVQATLIVAIPYAAAAVGMVAIGRSSDRSGERLMHVAVPSAIAAVAFCASAFLVSPVLAIIALSVAAIGDLSTRGPFWALPTRFLAGSAAAGGIALINMMASFGGLVGPAAVGLVRKLTGGFAGGLIFLGIVMLAGALATLLLRNARVLDESPSRQP
ncbi:MAG TPA: MFS transporter [Gammaproteobacteria bacterium]|nr:MFS transporter [Gammaproteobacteria bacterium]